TGEKRASDGFFVERPKVFQRTAAASHNQEICIFFPRGKPANSFDQFRSGVYALYAGVMQVDRGQRPATLQRVANIVESRPRRRGDDSDVKWKARQRLFVNFLKESLFLKPGFQFFKGFLQRPDSGLFYGTHNQLVFAVRGIDLNVAAGSDL